MKCDLGRLLVRSEVEEVKFKGRFFSGLETESALKFISLSLGLFRQLNQ